MALRPRIYYNAEQKIQMWDRWQKGNLSMPLVGFLIDLLLRSLISYLQVVVFVLHRNEVPLKSATT